MTAIDIEAFNQLALLQGIDVSQKMYCSKCDKPRNFRLKQETAVCRIVCRMCNRSRPITKGTIFEGMKVPISIYLKAIYILKLLNLRTEAKELVSELGIEKEAALKIRKKVKTVTTDKIEFKLLVAMRKPLAEHYEKIRIINN